MRGDLPMARKTGKSGASTRGTAPAEPIAAGVFAFEGDWDSDLRKQWSIDTMLDAVRGFGEIKYIHRDIGTVPELEYYVNKWLQRRYDAYQVGYFGFHGDPGSLWLDGKRHVSLEDLEAMIDGRAEGRVIHFGSCSVMRARDDRLRTFRRNTRARAVIGYRKTVYSNLELAAFELLLLEALSRYSQTGAPARHLRNNYESLCDKLGFKYIY